MEILNKIFENKGISSKIKQTFQFYGEKNWIFCPKRQSCSRQKKRSCRKRQLLCGSGGKAFRRRWDVFWFCSRGSGLHKAGKQLVQLDERGVDHVDVVDDRTCAGEDAGDVVEHLANIQEGVVGIADAAVQIDQFLFFNSGVGCRHFHGRHNDFPFH